MNIASYIVEYLKEHQRVAVPGFGEFILKNSKAVVDEQAKSILPPAKEVAFNVDYEIKDSYLAQYISQKSGTANDEVQSHIAKLTGYWKKQLAENQILSIEGLGEFHQTENDVKFLGKRFEKSTPDFYGLEEINLQNLKSLQNAASKEGDYKFNRSLLWIFLLILPIVGIIVLAFTQRERIFGKKSFDDLSVTTSTHRITTDSVKLKQQKLEQLRVDSLKQDSITKDSVANAAPVYKKPSKKYSSKQYNSKKWRKTKKRANR